MYYVRKEHDQAYRRVQLDLDVKPGQYQPFTENTSKIEVSASAVLEVRRDDGTEEVIPRPESERRRFLYSVSASDPQCLCISGVCRRRAFGRGPRPAERRCIRSLRR